MKFVKKSLGQNFLIDQNIIKKIVNLKDIRNKDVIEIGPGKGALTKEILKKNPKSLILIEKDSSLVEELEKRFSKEKCLKIFNADILKFDIEKFIKSKSVIMGNLPYNISSQILVKILRLNWPPKFDDLILMFQKELGEKIISKYMSSGYGRLSILANFRLKSENKFLISPNCFFPKPKVKSMVIHFKPQKNQLFKIKKLENLEKITSILFSNKRKMINKNLRRIPQNQKIIKKLKLKINLRPSEVKPETYYKITELSEKQ